MERPIEILEAAAREFDEAFDWYAERSHGAAIGFASALDRVLEKILADPKRFGRTYAGCQYCKLDRYPYCAIYLHSDANVTVVAIAHAKRRPGYWRDRV
jgi:plasmid stabilization system protein ParE